MELLIEVFSEGMGGAVDNHINALEMIGGFHHIIYLDGFSGANRICLEDIPGLIMVPLAAHNMVRVVGGVNLQSMVDPADDNGGVGIGAVADAEVYRLADVPELHIVVPPPPMA